MNYTYIAEGNVSWQKDCNQQLLTMRTHETKYNNKRCNCKCSTKAMQQQQQKQHQEYKQQQQQELNQQLEHSFENQESNDVEVLLTCCRKQYRAERTTAIAKARRDAATTKLKLSTTFLQETQTVPDCSLSTAKNSSNNNYNSSNRHSSLRNDNSELHNASQSAAIIHNLLFAMKFQLNTCDNSKKSLTSTSLQSQSLTKSPALPISAEAALVALHKNSMEAERNNNTASSCSQRQQHAVCSSTSSQLVAIGVSATQSTISAAAAAAKETSPPTTTIATSTTAINAKHSQVLPCSALFLLQTIACVLKTFSLFSAHLVQRCWRSMQQPQQQQKQNHPQAKLRKYYSFLLCSLLYLQLLSLTPTTYAERGSSTAALGLEIALGAASTTALSSGSGGDVQQHFMTAIQEDAELAVALQAHKHGNGNRSNSSVRSSPGSQNFIQFINRDHVLERAYVKEPTVSLPLPYSSCQSCQMREKAKQENLESIKEHILMRLKLSKLPNITAPIQVPHKIIENFYKMGAKKKFRHSGSAQEQQRFDVFSHELASDSMQGDDPQAYAWQDFSYDSDESEDDDDDDDDDEQWHQSAEKATMREQEEAEEEEDNFEEQFYSRVNSVYVFPTTPRIRHNRKHEILNFKLDQNHSTITHTIVHVYIRGRDWISKYDPALLEHQLSDGKIEKRHDIVITVHRAVRRQNATSATHIVKLSETRHKIPKGLGQWIKIDVKQLPSLWTSSRNATQGIVIKGLEPWMRSFIVTGSSSNTNSGAQSNSRAFAVFIELLTKDDRKTRRKRSTSLDCSESDNEVRCCRYPLRVNFTNFGWNWVVAPTSFNAYFCNGECKLGFLEKHAHTHLASLSTSAQPCCSPTKMSPLQLLYFNSDQILVLSTIPNMSVEKCSCS